MEGSNFSRRAVKEVRGKMATLPFPKSRDEARKGDVAVPNDTRRLS